MSSPPPVRWATYPGDVTDIVGEVKGPNLLGESLTAVTAEYDLEADQTRVGFTYQTVEAARTEPPT